MRPEVSFEAHIDPGPALPPPLTGYGILTHFLRPIGCPSNFRQTCAREVMLHSRGNWLLRDTYRVGEI